MEMSQRLAGDIRLRNLNTLTSGDGVAVNILELIRLPLVDGVEVIGKSSVAFVRASLLRSKMDNKDFTTQSRVGP